MFLIPFFNSCSILWTKVAKCTWNQNKDSVYDKSFLSIPFHRTRSSPVHIIIITTIPVYRIRGREANTRAGAQGTAWTSLNCICQGAAKGLQEITCKFYRTVKLSAEILRLFHYNIPYKLSACDTVPHCMFTIYILYSCWWPEQTFV